MKWFLFLLTPCFLFAASLSYETTELPEWVDYKTFPLEAVSLKPSQVNTQCLLIDTQDHASEHVYYAHIAVKPLTQKGIEAISTLEIEADPTFEKVLVHMVRVYRNGQWLDRLKTSRVEVIQREESLEFNLYFGTQTLVYFLDDIRENDILEYAYSISGTHPILSSHYSRVIDVQKAEEIEMISHRLLASRDTPIYMRPVNTDCTPTIADLPDNLREWVWTATNTAPYKYEPHKPSWYQSGSFIEISQYQNWHEVAHKFASLCTLPPHFHETADPLILELIQSWMDQTKDPYQRALLALKFVQDEVRYLGFEEGVKGFKPHEPNLIFQRRFGDCKDKSMLLHALLSLMDISSTPLLVNSRLGKVLPHSLASHRFDHMVLRIEFPEKHIYVDPTWSLQGGDLHKIMFPLYHYGCILSDSTQELTPLPLPILTRPNEIITTIQINSEEVATLTIKRNFYDGAADFARRLLTWQGYKNLSEYFLHQLEEEYGDLTVKEPLTITDDREMNQVTSTECYELNLCDCEQLELYSFIHDDFLEKKINIKRTTPFSLSYPLWIKEHIHVESPFNNWESQEDENHQEHESMSYHFHSRKEGTSADYEIELNHLMDHIPVSSLRTYWQSVNRIPYKFYLDLTD